MARLYAFMTDQKLQIGLGDNSVNLAVCIDEEEPVKEDFIQIEELKMTTSKLDDLKVDVQGPLLEVNLGGKGDHRPI